MSGKRSRGNGSVPGVLCGVGSNGNDTYNGRGGSEGSELTASSSSSSSGSNTASSSSSGSGSGRRGGVGSTKPPKRKYIYGSMVVRIRFKDGGNENLVLCLSVCVLPCLSASLSVACCCCCCVCL